MCCTLTNARNNEALGALRVYWLLRVQMLFVCFGCEPGGTPHSLFKYPGVLVLPVRRSFYRKGPIGSGSVTCTEPWSLAQSMSHFL